MTFIDRLRSNWERFDRLDPGLPFLFLLATVALWVRMPNLLFTPSLWAEDVSFLISGVLRSGLASVLIPSSDAAYHLLFQKLVAALLILVPLKYAELMFHLAAVSVIYFAFFATWKCLPTSSFTARVAACLAILYVPINPSSIYLTLANTQWVLGPVTMLLIVSNYVPGSRHKFAWCTVLVVLCLTGPFAVIALPVVFARMAFYRDFRREKLFYSSILVPIAVQCITLIKYAGARLNITTSDSLRAWYRGIVDNTILQFIPNRFLFLLFVVFLLVYFLKLAQDRNQETIFQVCCLLFIAITNVAAGFYSLRYMPESVGPFGPGERYFLLPFMLFIYLILFSARGALKPVGLFFVGFACVANARPIESGTDGRGPNYWKSQIEASQYLEVTPVMTRPVWPNEFFKHEIRTVSPQIPPVLRSLDPNSFELIGLAASGQSHGRWQLSSNIRDQADGKDLLNGTWNFKNVMSSQTSDGVMNVSVLDRENMLYETFSGIDPGGTLIFSFEGRSDAPLIIKPHLTDFIAGTSFAATLGPEWQRFFFDIYIKPMSAKSVGTFVVLNSEAMGSFQIRNVRATLDSSSRSPHEHYMLLRIPRECGTLNNVALTYSSSVAQSGVHSFNASATRDHFKDWNTQHRWVGPAEKNILFAVPNNGVQWIRIRVDPPLEMRDIVLRCF